MKLRGLTIIASVAAALLVVEGFASPPAFQGGSNRTQGQGQQGRQGLTPDKKRTLSNYGPEDVFQGGESEQTQRSRNARSAGRQNNNSRAAARAAETSEPAGAPEPSPSASPATAVPAALTTTPTPQATINFDALANRVVGSNRSADADAPGWLIPALSALSILVFASLIFVLYRLTLRIRDLYRAYPKRR